MVLEAASTATQGRAGDRPAWTSPRAR